MTKKGRVGIALQYEERFNEGKGKCMIKKVFNRQFIIFLFVGGVNTLFGYSVYALFIFWQFHYIIASSLATVLGILFNFKTTGTVVFKNTDNRLLTRFFQVYGVIYIINLPFLHLFYITGFNMYLAGALLILPSALLSFTLNKKFVFEVKR